MSISNNFSIAIPEWRVKHWRGFSLQLTPNKMQLTQNSLRSLRFFCMLRITEMRKKFKTVKKGRKGTPYG